MRIDNKFIDERYNIDVERGTKEVKKYVGTLDLDFSGYKSVQEFKEFIDEKLEKYGNSEDCFIECDYYGYDGALDINVYKTEEIPETKREVYERLKKAERAKITKQKKLEEARKLLREAGEL